VQNGGGISVGIYFSTDKSVDRVHASVDRPGALGPPWTDGGADRRGAGHGGALTGTRPPAAPVRQSSPAGAQKGERSMGSSTRASPELGRCCSDRGDSDGATRSRETRWGGFLARERRSQREPAGPKAEWAARSAGPKARKKNFLIKN
jgi:hypothetical protein